MIRIREIEFDVLLWYPSSSLITSPCPLDAAHKSAVRQYLSLRLGSTLFCPSNSLTTSACSLYAANTSAVWPSQSLRLSSMSFCSSSSLTTSAFPPHAANESAVRSKPEIELDAVLLKQQPDNRFKPRIGCEHQVGNMVREFNFEPVSPPAYSKPSLISIAWSTTYV